jgi:hypothetical protein
MDISPARGLGNSTLASVPPVDGPARLRPTKSSFRANSASIHNDTAAFGFGSSKSGRGFPLTEQEKPRAARSIESRNSYASGIRIPHSSPSHEATHTWLSGSVSRQASPSARNEEKTWLRAENTYMFRPRQPQWTRHRHSRCHYKQNSGSVPAGMNNLHTGEPAGRQAPGDSPATSAGAAMVPGQTQPPEGSRSRTHSRDANRY